MSLLPLLLLQILPQGTIGAPPGFRVERILTSRGAGSWVCMTVDPQGRLIVSPQFAGGLHRITLGTQPRIERLDVGVGNAQGLLHALGSLYVVGEGPQGVGLYRLPDPHGDGSFGEVILLRRFSPLGEHGPHAIVLGPDGMLYLVQGNHCRMDASPASPHRHASEDHLLPRILDPGGHARGIRAPGGYVLRTDPDGREWVRVAAGLRNAYDIAFNADGELFTWDSDMEWDVGLPWYRPTRVLHVVSGGEFGWRTGSSKWPAHYPDGLPSVVDVGRASPTGMTFGTRSGFPAPFRRALFIGDWTQGRILAVHMKPRGASYEGWYETFVSGRGLNVTDMEFGADGALYFLTGGRRTGSHLYRVRWTGGDSTSETPARDDTAVQARLLRRRIEALHAGGDVEQAWPYLDHPDRHVRFAARVAVENRGVGEWSDRALAETRPRAALAALLALVRAGGDPRAVAARVLALWRSGIDASLRLEALRVLSLACMRGARPDAALLDASYPSGDTVFDRELVRLLVHLGHPAVAAKTLALLRRTEDQADEIHFAYVLRVLDRGWTPGLRLAWFRWLRDMRRRFAGGRSFDGYLKAIQTDALARVPEEERRRLAAVLAEPAPPAAPTWADEGPRQRTPWKVSDLVVEPTRITVDSRRRGEALYGRLCRNCHAFRGAGGRSGQDLTTAGRRFSRRDLLEAILEPSKVISDQYQQERILTAENDLVLGRILRETASEIVVSADPMSGASITIRKQDVVERSVSRVSSMPGGLLDPFRREEIRDLLTFLELCAADPLLPEAGFDGWTAAPGWSIRGGMAVGAAQAPARLGWEGRPLQNFELRYSFKGSAGGVLVRGHYLVGLDGSLAAQGRGVLAPAGRSVRIQSNGSRTAWALPARAAVVAGWNTAVVRAFENHIRITVNGTVTADVFDDRAGRYRLRGPLALQVAGGEVRFRDVSLVRIRQ